MSSGQLIPARLRVLDDRRILYGFVDEGFGAVADAFISNFRDRADLGSGCTVYIDGRLTVDVWGGLADANSGRAWERETAAVMFSCSKGILALCAYLLVQDGLLDLDATVTEYWPEFGQNGKGTITVRDAMSHRGGVAALDTDFTRAEVLAWEPVIAAIEAQRPMYRPGDGHAYHALTYGWLVGEIVRRVAGSTPGAFFADAVARPLGLKTWIGLPDEARHLVARMEAPLCDEDSDAARRHAEVYATFPAIGRSLTMGGAFAFPADDGYVTFNDRDIQAAEIPGANGISTARSLALMYSTCVESREPLLRPTSINDLVVARSEGQQLTGLPDDGARWGTGFQLDSPPTQPMLGPTSFGHAGAGGQLAFANADHRVGFAYLSNQMGGYGDARSRELSTALARCLGSNRRRAAPRPLWYL